MRITVNLPDEVLRITRLLARRKRVSLGSALAELARAGIESAFDGDRGSYRGLLVGAACLISARQEIFR